MRIHTAFRHDGIPAYSVHGALTDHLRLIRQFEADPLMYYLFGEKVISMRQRGFEKDRPISDTFKILAGVDRKTYVFKENSI